VAEVFPPIWPAQSPIPASSMSVVPHSSSPLVSLPYSQGIVNSQGPISPTSSSQANVFLSTQSTAFPIHSTPHQNVSTPSPPNSLHSGTSSSHLIFFTILLRLYPPVPLTSMFVVPHSSI
ncbi:hypothetical protein U1Q18_029069, partial [Sarracenia purpurea var. burkii]